MSMAVLASKATRYSFFCVCPLLLQFFFIHARLKQGALRRIIVALHPFTKDIPLPIKKLLYTFCCCCLLCCALAFYSTAAAQPTDPLPRIEQSAPVPPPDPQKIDRSQSLKQELQQYLATTDLTQVLKQAAQVRIPTHVQQYALLGLVLLGIAGYIITVCCEAIDLVVRLGIEKCSDWLFILCARIGKKLQPHWQAMQQELRRLWQQYGLRRAG